MQRVAGGVVFSDYTWVGYFVAVTAAGYVLLIAMVLKVTSAKTASMNHFLYRFSLF